MKRHDWGATPAAYVYWHQKAAFDLERDIYDNWTMFAAEDGRFAYSIGDHKGEAGFGDLVVCPPGIPFIRRTITPLTFHFFHFEWDSEVSEEEALSLSGKLTVADVDRLASNYRYIREIDFAGRQEPAFGRMKHWLHDIWRLVEHSSAAGADRAAGSDSAMQTARQWLLAHAFAPLVYRELSDMLGISPVQLTRRFRAAYRMTPSAFVTELRLSRACRLLAETALTLDAIAQKCGYENGFYLSRVFHDKKGTSPSAYRKLHRI
ncbi:helix-turn-helix domain-containing protein [Paenibacillus sp. MBLB4367]|uniref:AraC family transcriptional regulator n=1 Tax=Paenibacillus sp. MBLB4367 TaxID=3384767 RepID=UPI00390804C8